MGKACCIQAHPIPHSVVSIHDLEEELLDVGQGDVEMRHISYT